MKHKDIRKPFNKCPVCGGELTEKNVEKILRGGVNTDKEISGFHQIGQFFKVPIHSVISHCK